MSIRSDLVQLIRTNAEAAELLQCNEDPNAPVRECPACDAPVQASVTHGGVVTWVEANVEGLVGIVMEYLNQITPRDEASS